MEPIIILDFLISRNNGTKFYYDNRYCDLTLLKEVILEGFQVCNLNRPWITYSEGHMVVLQHKYLTHNSQESAFFGIGNGGGFGYSSGWGHIAGTGYGIGDGLEPGQGGDIYVFEGNNGNENRNPVDLSLSSPILHPFGIFI